ncbi:MAG: hypothetical protein GKR88_02830 [Flavobacteriaceae bacterium]|nr:MAG: hypothetical protein GKR88_02830 [Flavobacteriaceae bacterium]
MFLKKEYQLLTIKEVEAYIKENGYLPKMPSEKEVEKNGVLLGQMNKKLLEKIEELTLYTIAQENKLKKQEERLKEQNQKNKELEARLAKLELLLLKESPEKE